MSAAALALGLLLPYGTQPGFDAALAIELHRPRPQMALVLRPRAGVYVRPRNHWTTTMGAHFGVALSGRRGLVSHTLALGLDYRLRSNTDSVTIDLASGAHTPSSRISHHLLPAGSYRLAHQPGRFGWYLGLSVGHEFSPTEPHQIYAAVEAGLRIRLGAGPAEVASQEDQ